MSNWTQAEIQIGGTVKRELIPDLVKALNQDQATHEYGDAFIPEDASEADLLEYRDVVWAENTRGGPLKFVCDQARNGEFEETETFCQKHEISFDRMHDSFAGYVGERARFRPGMTEPVVEYVDVDGHEIIAGKIVREALAKLNSYSNTSTHVDGERDEELFDAACQLLDDACPTLPLCLVTFNVVA